MEKVDFHAYSYQHLPKKANKMDRTALCSKSWSVQHNDAEAFTVLLQICWINTKGGATFTVLL